MTGHMVSKDLKCTLVQNRLENGLLQPLSTENVNSI